MVTFTIPAYTDAELTIELPNPELFDSHSYTKDINVHVSRSKAIRTVVFSDDLRKRVIKTNLNFKLTLDKMKELEEFLETAKGEYIKYVDYEGFSWIILIDQETIEFSSQGTGRGECLYRGEIFDVSLTLKKWKDGYGTVANPAENETNI